MDAHGGHAVHERVGDIFDDDGDVPVPDTDRLVVRGRDEPAVFVDEGDGVDRPEMLVVFLRDLARLGVVLRAISA
jgi:hypothetical protein